MPEVLSPIILMGATTMGKSDIGNEIADITNAEIVNADKFYLYAGKVFMLGLGLGRDELQDGRPRHLYGSLEPFDEPLAAEQYLAAATEVISEIHASGKPVIVDGCIRSYNAALVGHYGLNHAVGITCDNRDKQNWRTFIRRRGQQLIRMGLFDEAEYVEKEGYSDTFPVREGFIYKHAINAVKGVTTKEEAEELMISGGLDLAQAQDATYMSMPGLRHIVHDRKRADVTARSILRMLHP